MTLKCLTHAVSVKADADNMCICVRPVAAGLTTQRRAVAGQDSMMPQESSLNMGNGGSFFNYAANNDVKITFF